MTTLISSSQRCFHYSSASLWYVPAFIFLIIFVRELTRFASRLQFFNLQIVQNVTMAIGPIAHYHENSKYYSAVKPRLSIASRQPNTRDS